MIDEDRVLAELKALNILQVARDIGREPNRQNLIHCTFHDEKSPSLKLYPKQGRFKCFGCGQSGSTIDLYASAGNGIDFSQAVQEMKSRYLGLLDTRYAKARSSNPPQRLARPVSITSAGQSTTEPLTPSETFSPIYLALQTFCRQHPPTETKRQALAYLLGRAFTAETIRRFGLFVIPDVKATADFLSGTFERSLLEAAGLFSPKQQTSTGQVRPGGFVFYKHPVIIPYLKAGQIVNLQGRCLGEPPAKGWKYHYLYNRPIVTMFNADSLQSLEKGSKVYLTEGAFDAMAACQKGGTAVSMNSASSFKPEWVSLFAGLKVCFWLDADEAGQKAINKLTPLFRQAQIPISKKLLPGNCKDVNDWLIQWSGQVNGYPAFWDQ